MSVPQERQGASSTHLADAEWYSAPPRLSHGKTSTCFQTDFLSTGDSPTASLQT